MIRKSFVQKLSGWMLVALLPLLFTGCSEFFEWLDRPVIPRLRVKSDTITLKVGATASCEATTQDNVALLYASANPEVATVDANGLITAIAEGTTEITIKAIGADEYYRTQIFGENTATITVTVIPMTKPGSISFATANIIKRIGDSAFTNELTLTGDGTVSYSSNNNNVATVNTTTGEVTIVDIGTATITAIVTDGADYTYAQKTAEYTVDVKGVELAAVTASEVGWRIGSDGLAYTPTCSLPTGVSAVAVIFYVGAPGTADASSTTYRGLAIAMTDASSSKCAWSGTDELSGVSSSTNLADHKAFFNGINDTQTLITKYGADYAAYIAKNYSVAAPVGTSGWFLGSSGQWFKFFEAAGINVSGWNNWTDYAPAPIGGDDVDNLTIVNAFLSTAGASEIKWIYWSSSEYDQWTAGEFTLSPYYGLYMSHLTKNGSSLSTYVRSFLAF